MQVYTFKINKEVCETYNIQESDLDDKTKQIFENPSITDHEKWKAFKEYTDISECIVDSESFENEVFYEKETT